MGVADGDTALQRIGVTRGHAQKSGCQTCKRAIDYTKKENTAIKAEDGSSLWKEVGVVPAHQRKVGEQMETLREVAEQGGDYRDMLYENCNLAVRYANGLSKMIQIVKPDRPKGTRVSVYLIWGKTNLGKTHAIFEQLEAGNNIYNKLHPVNQQATDYWEGYEGQDVVLFDDFHPFMYSLRQLLQYLHEWQIRVPIKGASAKALWTRVYITTNVPPNLWYQAESMDPLHKGNYEALWRRIPPENIIRYVERIPDHIVIEKPQDIKQYQDAACARAGVNPLAAEDDKEDPKREAATKYVKKMDRAALERIVVEELMDRWKKLQ